MFTNKDIEDLMLAAESYKVPDKCNEVALKLGSASQKYDIARKILNVWNERKNLNKAADRDKKLTQWRAVPFPIPLSSDAAQPAPSGRPPKRLRDDPCAKTENNILDPIIADLECKAREQDISPRLLLEKLNARANQKWAKKTLQTKTINKYDVPVEDACAIVYNINLSIQQYQKLRIYLTDHTIKLPVRNLVDKYKKTLQCPFTVEATKTSCELPVLVEDTLKPLLELESYTVKKGDVVHIEAKMGIDGSGSHQLRHQLAESDSEDDDEEDDEDEAEKKKEDEKSYIGIFWCPLSIQVNGEVVWTNILPNSTMYSRPLCLLRAKENRESVTEHFTPYLDAAHNMEQLSAVTIIPDTSSSLSVHTELSMVDGKMVDLIQGDSGSFCHYCTASRAEANNIEFIMQGFSIEKTVEEMQEIWDQMESGEISYTSSERAGQCHEPLNKNTIQFYGILHQKLRSLDNMLKLLYHLVSGQTHTWSESNPRVKDAVKAAKQEVITHIRTKCGFLVDSPTTVGGNSNAGPVAEKFFGAEHRANICDVIRHSSHKSLYSELLSYFNKILTITQQCDTTKIVRVDMVKQLGQALMIHYKQSFPFAMISPSVHMMAAHSWELFQMTEGKPIAVYAEQSGEAWNKHIRAYKSGPSARARQCSIRLNTADIFTRMLVQSHPRMAAKRKIHKCSHCKKHGHTIRSCPDIVSTVLNAERSYIASCYV